MKRKLFFIMIGLYACIFLLGIVENFTDLKYHEFVFEFMVLMIVVAGLIYTVLVYFYLIPERKGGWVVSHLSRPQIQTGTDWMTIVTVLDQQTMLLTRLALERSDIPCFVRHEGIQNLGFWAFTPNCEMDIQVPALYAAEAQRVLHEELPEEGADIAWKAAETPGESDDFDAGLWYYNFGDYQRALELFQTIAQQEDQDRDVAFFNIACCHVQLGCFLEARLALKEAIRLDCDNYYDALTEENLAPLHDWLKENERFLNNMASVDEADNYQAGLWHYSLGDYVRALELFQVVVEQKDPDLDGAHFNIACCYTQLGRLLEARKELTEAIQLDPQNYYDAIEEPDLAPHHNWLTESEEFTNHFPL